MKADFGFTQHRTRANCKKPVFSDRKLHLIAIMKDEHVGSKGDREEGGAPGFISKFICAGCGKRYKLFGFSGFFHHDADAISP